MHLLMLPKMACEVWGVKKAKRGLNIFLLRNKIRRGFGVGPGKPQACGAAELVPYIA